MKYRFVRKAFVSTLGAIGVPLAYGPAKAADSYTLRLNLPNTAETIAGMACLRFASGVTNRSNGQVKVEVYPAGQLANERDAIQDLTSGVLDMSCQSSALLATLVPQFQILDVPFLVKDIQAGLRVLNGKAIRGALDDLDSKGIDIYGWGFNGFKELQTTTKSVVVPDDMKGLRIRIQNSVGAVATYKALGALPIVIDVSEVYPALQQHTIDAVDASMDAFVTFKYYNITKHCAMLNHIFSAMPLLVSKRKIGALSPAMQSLLRDEGKNMTQWWLGATTQRIADDIKISKDNGVAFNNVEYAIWRKAVEPAWAVFQQRIGGDLIERASREASGA